MTALARAVRAADLELEFLDPNSVAFVRLFKYAGGDWSPADESFRNSRADPPAGRKDAFAALYMADSLAAAAIESRVMWGGKEEHHYEWSVPMADERSVVRYAFSQPAIFIRLDAPNDRRLGLAGNQRSLTRGYEPFQTASLALWERFGRAVHGLSWASQQRNSPGRVYALWHEHKDTIGLSITSTAPYSNLSTDADWVALVNADPSIEAIR